MLWLLWLFSPTRKRWLFAINALLWLWSGLDRLANGHIASGIACVLFSLVWCVLAYQTRPQPPASAAPPTSTDTPR